MPLVRKSTAARAQGLSAPPTSLTAGSPEERWIAIRAAAENPDGVALLSSALAQESDPRLREAIFTGFARIGTVESAGAVLPCLRSDDASLRTGALDALRAMPAAAAGHLSSLLADPDPDVRLLSCELARGLPADEANRLMTGLIDREIENNVCAAAVEVLAEIGNETALPALQRSAARFADDPFLAFSIKVAIERLAAPARTT